MAKHTFSRRSVLSAGAAALTSPALRATGEAPQDSGRKPNILVIIADQVRSDAVGAYGANPMDLTPHLDAMAARGTLYRHMFTNQPVCSPSRACLFTGQYPARHGVWKNTSREVGIQAGATTLATECKKAGYSANYIGKWHLAKGGIDGPVPPEDRGGFTDLWEAANALELTSHAYSGDLYDAQGKPIRFEGEYRVDFLTDRAVRFLQNVNKSSPFLLVLSYLEPHQQNDEKRMIAPEEYAHRYRDPFVPEDLKHFPGDWQQQLPDYYGALKRVDDSLGKLQQALVQQGLDENTIIVFLSDHGCHFMTRNTEYKRSGHDASLRIPFIIQGPGFEGGREVRQLVSMVDVTPTLLAAARLPVPATMQGKSTLPLLSGTNAPWRDEIFVQMSEFWVARALRTKEWTYVVAAPREDGKFQPEPHAPAYTAFQLYGNRADPYQLVNLAGRKETVQVEEHLRERLKERMQEAGDSPAELRPCAFPYA
jgi:arylsulfatase A-like enzyme